MVNITTWFLLGTAGMVIGSLAMAWAARQAPREQYRENALLVLVGAIAAVAYGLMALGVGGIPVGDGNVVFLPRYVDWLLTTPLHVVFLGLLAGAPRRRLAQLAGLQAATIVLGLGGALAGPPLNGILFLAGGATFAGVLSLLYRPVRASIEGRSDTVVGLYEKLRNFVAVLWLVYPVIWLLAPSGFGLMDVETQTMVITYIDVVAKVGFGLIALDGRTVAAHLDSGVAAESKAGGAGGDVEGNAPSGAD